MSQEPNFSRNLLLQTTGTYFSNFSTVDLGKTRQDMTRQDKTRKLLKSSKVLLLRNPPAAARGRVPRAL